MTKQRQAQLITAGILAVALGAAVYRKGGFQALDFSRWMARASAKSDATPQDAIYAMLDAARDGKAADYLAAHTGQMEASLRKAVAEATEAGFAKYLKETNAPIKGIALQEPQPLTDREVKVRVEYVYQDRNEVQWMYLEKVGSSWKIARVDGAERIKTLVPYGTPVR
ncbi:MAG: hypothetical protein HY235_27455 [Acidobacteria bacterium]|nr:hypothetical protein [Acidobacteriota bacterium]